MFVDSAFSNMCVERETGPSVATLPNQLVLVKKEAHDSVVELRSATSTSYFPGERLHEKILVVDW